ncbi:MAG TPA: hypothetical protein VK021_03340 [Flavobacteriaceae bacterium]|nr:hypothetical protein [Flavobacteriaceae bacterium]
MKKRILNYLAKYIAKFYWGYLKKEIDSYIINIQASNFESFGQNIKFKGSVTIFHPENISIADNVQIGENIYYLIDY